MYQFCSNKLKYKILPSLHFSQHFTLPTSGKTGQWRKQTASNYSVSAKDCLNFQGMRWSKGEY